MTLGGAALEHGGDGGPLLLHVVEVVTHATRVVVVDVLHHVVVVEVGTM